MPSETFFNLPAGKKRKILNAATAEFGARGLKQARMSEIARLANISRGSMYTYISSLDDLYIYMFEALRGERAEYVQPAFELYKKEPFIDFYDAFYLRDSRFLLNHPAHIELGKHLYTSNDNVSRMLISQLRRKYHDIFLLGIEYDKERGLIRSDVDLAVLCDLCVHLVTDVFIFQTIHDDLAQSNLDRYWAETRKILQHGVSGVKSIRNEV
ncbi:MAG: TetR/AcrR family transcriptional regulator [Oscillospiraceae bacterium]|jgi:AcrR family transcriptional regulator|nr:TetR/AcrR family transcriptional regulator [Oscillospiraceae bacterium]